MASQVGRFSGRAVRSQLIAGAAAVVSVSAIATSAVTVPDLDHPSLRVPTMATVELAALANPVLELFDTLDKANLYLFSIAEPPVTTFDRAGIIPDFLAAGAPILSQYFLNASDYVNKTIQYLIRDYADYPTYAYPGALRLLVWALDALPKNIVYAAQQVFAGNLVGALQTFNFAVINPVQAALYQTLNAGLYVLGGVGDRSAAVITAIAEQLPTTIRHIADSATIALDATEHVVENVAYGIQTLSPERIWNALVVGLLGTSSDPSHPTIPDALINQTIGEGGRLYFTSYQPGPYTTVPSLRQDLIELRDAITDALATDVPVPDNPPFEVSKAIDSFIPTPWQPTPVAAPVQATASASSTTSTTTAAVEQPSVATTAANNTAEASGNGSDAARSGAQSADTSRDDSDESSPNAVRPTHSPDGTGRTKARLTRSAGAAAQSATGATAAKPSGRAVARSAAQ